MCYNRTGLTGLRYQIEGPSWFNFLKCRESPLIHVNYYYNKELYNNYQPLQKVTDSNKKRERLECEGLRWCGVAEIGVFDTKESFHSHNEHQIKFYIGTSVTSVLPMLS